MKRILVCTIVLLTIALAAAFVESVPGSGAPAKDAEISSIVSSVDSTRIQNTVLRLEAFGTRQSCSTNAPAGRGVNAARDWIFSQYSSISGLQVRLDPFVHGSCPTLPTFNVIAWLPGTRHPERLVIIGGHYDSRTINVSDSVSDAPGANDAGAQTAVVLELARVLSTRPHDNTLVFISFSGEEQGLFGSSSIAANLTRYFEEPQVVAMLNTDIPGGDNTVNGPAELQHFRLYSPGIPRELRTTDPDGSTDNTSPSRGLMRYVSTWGGLYVPAMTMNPKLREDRPGRASDHRSFINQGNPAVRIMETFECSPSPVDNSCGGPLPCPPPANIPASCRNFNTSHQHSPFDQSQFVTPSYAARIAQVMAASAASLARAPGSPKEFTADGNSVQGVTLSWVALTAEEWTTSWWLPDQPAKASIAAGSRWPMTVNREHSRPRTLASVPAKASSFPLRRWTARDMNPCLLILNSAATQPAAPFRPEPSTSRLRCRLRPAPTMTTKITSPV